MLKLKQHIEANGFNIKGRYIYKRSSSSKNLKAVGCLNENNFYFFAHNVYPFKNGVNFYNEETLVSEKELKDFQAYIKKEKEKEVNDFDISFEKYLYSTSEYSYFQSFLEDKIYDRININFNNYYDIRGVRNGYLKASTVFPIFDYDNNFVTAQIIKYGNNGKRVKSQFSTTWFHSYKPIKRDVDLKEDTKYSIPIKSFFGENFLNGSDNIVGIVEAPKTAVILKEFYPQIDWIATFGETQLINKNLDVLKGKEVVLFPDAKTTLWKKIASEKGFYICDVLENNDAEEGSDLADYIFKNCNISHDIHNYLNSILFDKKELKFKHLKLDFTQVKTSTEYFPILPFHYVSNGFNSHTTKELIHKTDNSSEFNKVFNGLHFDLYDNKYWVLNANVDFHKLQIVEGKKGYHFFDEEQFIFHLQKCFRALVYLNKDLSIEEAIDVFKIGLIRLSDHSNFRFNIHYVLDVLVPLWLNNERDITDFYKFRNWKFKGTDVLTKNEFEQFLNNDIFRYKLEMRLLGFKDALKENRFIDIETDLALDRNASKRGYTKIVDLVKQWNEKVIGAKTLKTYFNYLEISENIMYLDSCTKYSPPHNSILYRVVKKMYNRYSLSEWSEKLSVKNRNTLKSFFEFKPCRDTETLIIKEVDFLLKQIKEITPIRFEFNGKKRITDFIYKERISEKEQLIEHQQDWNTVFKPIERLVIDLENIKDSNLKDIYLYEIKYLTYLKELKIKYEKSIRNNLSNFTLDNMLKIKNEKEPIYYNKVVDF